MQRYFLELSYKGTRYSGFQVQENASTIQSETEKAFSIYYRKVFALTGSSRTDAGVHALQNFFHFDTELNISRKDIYHLNAILPPDIVIENIYRVPADAHSRFHAVSREYRYYIYSNKNPFLEDRAYYFPYTIDEQLLQEAATVLMDYVDFTSFSKRNTQVKTFDCNIYKSQWLREGDCLVYHVEANRFLRGMVRGLVATMLLVGRKKIDIPGFKAIIESRNCTKADFSTPPHGLFLQKVAFKLDLDPVP